LSIEFFIAAQAAGGVDHIDITINGEAFRSFPAEGQTDSVVRFDWIPENEGSYTIQAIVEDQNGQTSVPDTLTLTAAYPSEEARQEAFRQQVEIGVAEIRLPEPAATPAPVQPVTQTIENLHQQLFLGSESYSETEAGNDELILRAFRLIPDDFDLAAYINGLTAQELSGYYDPETLSVVAYTPIFGEAAAYNRLLAAHTVMHDLQIEEFGLGAINVLTLTPDNRMALRAQVEGEANFVQYNYLQSEAFTPEERASATDNLNQQALSLFNEAPPFLRAQFEFAYRSGFQFVQFLFNQGGFELVDSIWSNQPQSSEQILHPEKYMAGNPPQNVTVPSLADVLEGDWQLIGQDTLGEFYLQQHLSLFLTPAEAATAAEGWGGDQYIVYWNAAEDQLVMTLRLAWDDPAGDASEFATAYTNFLRRLYSEENELQQDGGQCWQGNDVTCFYQLGVQTLVVRAPDLETATNIAAAQTP
jgi:hypothetical protein